MPRRPNNSLPLGLILGLIAGVIFGATVVRAGDLEQIRACMEENFQACNHEDLPRLLATTSRDMPQRELFIETTKQEWEQSDLYYRLDDIRIYPQNEWRRPYLVCTVKQTITGVEPEEGQGQTDAQASNIFGLNTHEPTTEQEVLFKKEGGKWKVVASLTEPRASAADPVKKAFVGQEPCSGGNCKWPRSAERVSR